jgi:hypothetical protein
MPITPVDPMPREARNEEQQAPVIPDLAPHGLQPQAADPCSSRVARGRPTWESVWDAWNGSSGIKGSVFALSVIVLFSVIRTAEMIPSHALVVVDPVTRTYNTPSCAIGKPVAGTSIRTQGEAKALGYDFNAECWRNGGFWGRSESRWTELLRKMRFYPGRPSRWRADGSWRW